MKLALIAALAAGLAASSVKAEDAKSLTIEQCINILGGLNALNYVGQPLNDPNPNKPPPDAKQYKLGPARMTIGLDISALTPVQTAAQNAQQNFFRELAPLPSNPPSWKPGEPESSERIDAANKQNKAAAANWQEIIQKPCNVQPAHLKERELKIGDGPDENAFPPGVLAAIWPLIDR